MSGPHRWWCAVALAATACQGSRDKPASWEDSGGPSEQPQDSDTAPPEEPHPRWRLNEDIGSLVYVNWKQRASATGWVEYSFDDGVWLSTPPEELGPGTHEALLLGVPYGTDVTWRVVTDDGSGPVTAEELVATTEDLPSDAPVAAVRIADPDRWEPTGAYLFTSVGDYGELWRVIVDRQGRLVWAQELNNRSMTYYVRLAYNGRDLLWDQIHYATRKEFVVRAKIDGTVIEAIETPGLHHAFTELPDGTLYWGSNGGAHETLERRTPDGVQETVFDCPDFEAGFEDMGFDPCASNALFWDEASDTLLYSFYTSMTVVHLDRATGALLHSWGNFSDWRFEPVSSKFDWQHGVTMTPDGHLMLSTHVSLDSDEGVTREFEIDDDDDALREVWSFGEGDGVEAPYFGEAHRLPGGNTLQNYGTNARVREGTPEGDIVWDIAWEGSRGEDLDLIGRSVFIADLYDCAP